MDSNLLSSLTNLLAEPPVNKITNIIKFIIDIIAIIIINKSPMDLPSFFKHINFIIAYETVVWTREIL
jgi:hypothetical protein